MKTVVTFIIALAFLVMPYRLLAQQQNTQAPKEKTSGEQAQKREAPCPMMKEHHQKMRAEHQKMMKEMDARLDAKVAAMDAATGEKKMEAMADVIKEMVSQRKQMREHMMKMQAEHGKGHKPKGESEESGGGKGKSM